MRINEILNESFPGITPRFGFFENNDFMRLSKNFDNAEAFANHFIDPESPHADAAIALLKHKWTIWEAQGLLGYEEVANLEWPFKRFIGLNIQATHYKSHQEIGAPWSDTEMIGGSGSYIFLTPRGRVLMDADIYKGNILLSQISVEKRGNGLGSRVMEILKSYADQAELKIMVTKTTNHEFFGRFPWLRREDHHTYIYP